MSVGLAPRAMPERRVAPSRRPPHLDVRGLGRVIGGTQILHPVWFSARRGEVVAIAGGSGAGKSTLLDLLAGALRGDAGTVFVNGVAAGERTARSGSVPQDDIVHGELSLSRTLEYAAALRLSHPDRNERRRRIQRTLDAVGLGSSADVRVSSLSGGQRKRACIAAELLAEPELLLLDEPTSGLDPANAAELMAHLRSLAARGTTIVLTTHSPADLDRCDQVLMLAPGGRHVFTGSATMARARFGVDHLADAYSHLAAAPTLPPPHPEHPYDPTISARDADDESVAVVATTTAPDRPVGWIRQWAASTARTVELVLRNPLTLAIMLGSPVFVIAMLAALFRPDALDAGDPSGAIAVVFWVVFSAFFFGLTYGLLQIVAEREIFRRERMAGLRVGAYLAAKVAVLAPFLAVVDLAMLGVLEWSGQLPATSGTDSLALWGVLVAVSSASLTVGLAASALVRTAAQATLALPMLCFPQVLFAGAIVAVPEMAVPGRLLSAALVGRWGFESFGRTLGVGDAHARLPAGFDATFAGSATSGVVIVLTIAVASIAIAAFALRNR